MQPKIATCSYCGTRDTLVLGGRQQHTLACSNCGAPLQDLRAVPVEASAQPAKKAHRKAPKSPPHRVTLPFDTPPRSKKRKSRKKLARKLAYKAFDLLEDIFD